MVGGFYVFIELVIAGGLFTIDYCMKRKSRVYKVGAVMAVCIMVMMTPYSDEKTHSAYSFKNTSEDIVCVIGDAETLQEKGYKTTCAESNLLEFMNSQKPTLIAYPVSMTEKDARAYYQENLGK